MDLYQSEEQDGFRKHFNHLHTMRLLIEKCAEYNMTLNLILKIFKWLSN